MKARISWRKRFYKEIYTKWFLDYLENRYDKIHNCLNENTDMERLGRQYCLLYLVYSNLVFQTQNPQFNTKSIIEGRCSFHWIPNVFEDGRVRVASSGP